MKRYIEKNILSAVIGWERVGYKGVDTEYILTIQRKTTKRRWWRKHDVVTRERLRVPAKLSSQLNRDINKGIAKSRDLDSFQDSIRGNKMLLGQIAHAMTYSFYGYDIEPETIKYIVTNIMRIIFHVERADFDEFSCFKTHKRSDDEYLVLIAKIGEEIKAIDGLSTLMTKCITRNIVELGVDDGIAKNAAINSMKHMFRIRRPNKE